MTRLHHVSLALALALVTAGPRGALAEISVSPPQDLALLSANRGNPDSVSIAVLDDGSFAIGVGRYQRVPPDSLRSQFVIQFYDRNGSPLGAPVAPGGASYVPQGGVGSLGDRYFVTWENSRRVTRSAFYDCRGERLTKPVSWPQSEVLYFQRWYRFAPAPSLRILPLVFRQVGIDSTDSPIFKPILQVFDRRAHPLGTSFDLRPISANRKIEIETLGINGAGRFVVVSLQCPGSPQSQLACLRGVQVFDRGGRVLSPFLTANVEQLRNENGTAVGFQAAVREDGAFLLSWVGGRFTETEKLSSRLYDRNGVPNSAAFVLAENPGGTFGATRLARSAGVFVFSWEAYSPTLNTSTILLQERSGSTEPDNEPTEVTTDSLAAPHFLAMNSSGRGVIVWSTQHGSDQEGRFSRITVTPDEAQTFEAPMAGTTVKSGEPNEL